MTLRDRLSRIRKLTISTHSQWSACVLRKGVLASGRVLDPNRVCSIDEVEQHLLVIAAQAKDVFRIARAQLHYMFDAARNIRPTID